MHTDSPFMAASRGAIVSMLSHGVFLVASLFGGYIGANHYVLYIMSAVFGYCYFVIEHLRDMYLVQSLGRARSYVTLTMVSFESRVFRSVLYALIASGTIIATTELEFLDDIPGKQLIVTFICLGLVNYTVEVWRDRSDASVFSRYENRLKRV